MLHIRIQHWLDLVCQVSTGDKDAVSLLISPIIIVTQ